MAESKSSGHEMVSIVRKRSSGEDVQEGTIRRHEESTDFQLAKVGKKAVLRQNFGFFSMLSLSATTMGTWEGIVLLFSTSFDNGGYLGSFIAIWIVFLGTLCSTITMAEMVSMAPTAGGQYHWVAILAPKSCAKILSYLAAWFTIINWQASVASSCFAAAQTVQGMVSLSYPDYVPDQWQIPLMYWGFALVGLFFNSFAARILPQVESSIMLVHILGFFATLIPLVVWGPKGDPSVVFGTWENAGWDSQGLSFMVGLLGAAYAFSGADSAAHMCEEVPNANVRVPQAMVYGVLINGVLGVAILTALLFVLGDLDSVLNTDLAYPAYQVYYNAVGNVGGTVALAAIILFIVIGSIITFVATTSRATWAFSRDRGMPFWKQLAKVDTRTNLPLWSIFFTMAFAFVLSMIAFGSSLAFNDVVSLTVSSSFATYIMGNSLLLWRRTTGYIRPYNPENTEITNTTGADGLTWGPWKMPEWLGIITNVIGIAYLLVVTLFSFFPTYPAPTVADMNWSVFMFGVIIIFAVGWYFIHGRKQYNGPTVEVEADQIFTDHYGPKESSI